MIAFRNKKGRPLGSRDSRARLAPGMGVAGAATSAAKMNRLAGVASRAGNWLWIPSEGWVRWRDLAESVDVAYDAWRKKKAAQGIFIRDTWEVRQEQIVEAMQAKQRAGAVRAAWLREWRDRFAEIVERAA